jgi:3-oxoadipate enol-lactonase
MPFLETSGLRTHYALRGVPDAPVVVLSNSLGTNFAMWDSQLPELEKKFRVLGYDTRGHGQSSVTPGPYTIEQLARDALAMLDALKISRVHFCGLSMGGMIGMWLAIHVPGRLHRLVLSSTAPKIGTADTWNTRIDMIRKIGMQAAAPAVIERWLTPDFRARSPQVAAAILHMLENAPQEGYLACCAAVRDFDARESVSSIQTPALVISGTDDPATTPADVRALADGIPGARFLSLPASHLSNVEAPEQFNAALLEFL